VLEPLERVERPRDDVVRRDRIQARHEREAAGIVLEGRVVQPLRPQRKLLSPVRLLVRRGER
jgi:hypothetical protein